MCVVYIYMQIHMCVGVCVCMCVCAHRSNIDIRYLSQSLCISRINAGSVPWTQSLLMWIDSPAKLVRIPCLCPSCAGIMAGLHTHLVFKRVLGLYTPLLTLVWQEPYQLSHLPSPHSASLFFKDKIFWEAHFYSTMLYIICGALLSRQTALKELL